MPPQISRELYLDLEDDFNGGIGAPELSHRASSDPLGQVISPALYRGPDDMCNEHMQSLNPTTAECLPARPALDNEEVQAMVQEFQLFRSYHDVGYLTDQLQTYSQKSSRPVHTTAPGGRATILICLGGDIRQAGTGRSGASKDAEG
ncbi:uncharacterized protein EDB91DRAFT_1257095 [Suillus paluster]|uniref:uncharacterized protein n=1 Tax=Suillus paluster TaxID=48578 RepID=UPI001B8618B5|nr:uncharacterized protein EDB91DRAFT_1257095 [Suillus paluster]KAG1720201.1 hypothetical protein EDB91DRAFT_1257095 [Suillus paluster]